MRVSPFICKGGWKVVVAFCRLLSPFDGFRVFVLLCRALPSRSLARFRATGNNGRGRRNMKIKSESRAALAAMLSALGIPGDKQERAFAIMEGGDDYAPADVGRVIRAREVAERLGVSGRTVRLWGRKGLLRPVTGSGSRFFGYTAESVRALIEGRAGRKEVRA